MPKIVALKENRADETVSATYLQHKNRYLGVFSRCVCDIWLPPPFPPPPVFNYPSLALLDPFPPPPTVYSTASIDDDTKEEILRKHFWLLLRICTYRPNVAKMLYFRYYLFFVQCVVLKARLFSRFHIYNIYERRVKYNSY